MTCLPDVNVWIALAAERHILHTAARRWFMTLKDDKLVFCRITQMGFPRLLSNRHVMKEETVSPEQAWGAYASFRGDRRIGYLNEPAGLSETWRDFAPKQTQSPILWTDAYLCAFAAAGQIELVTFDANMPARPGVSQILLSSAP
jgi:toxin-antitoxin system PIN domain toxin